jgi:hypothetical protein
VTRGQIIFDDHDHLRPAVITFAHRRHFSRVGAPRPAIIFGIRPLRLPLND